MSKRKIIFQALTNLLINQTDAGPRVYRGRVRFSGSDDEFPLISIIVADSEVQERNVNKNRMLVPVRFVAAFPANLDNPGDMAEDLFEQMKIVLFADYNEGSPNGLTQYGTEKAKLIPDGESGIEHDDIDDFMIAAVNATLEYYETPANP